MVRTLGDVNHFYITEATCAFWGFFPWKLHNA